MSAIYGAIDFSGEHSFEKEIESFNREYEKYKIDSMNYLTKKDHSFGCGLQYFNEESRREKLPLTDEEAGVSITADCVIDNRQDLIEELKLARDTADGDIILQAYLKWGIDGCLNRLRGLFSFVIYDFNSKKAYMAVDHFAQRCLMYCTYKSNLYFSTLLFPLLSSVDLDFKENERWLVDTVSLRSPAMVTEPKETAVEGVLKVVSGTYLTLTMNGDELDILEHRYYDPQATIRVDNRISLKDSEDEIKRLMQQSVKNAIHTDSKVATQLSGGLDSSTVASIAAMELAKSGQNLYSYTSVPDPEAGLTNKGILIYDERAGVEEICAAHPNIKPTFVDSKGRSFLAEVNDILNIWEMPCKSQQNAIWLDEIYKQAASSGCKVILTGSTGNTTLSAGNMEDVAFHYIKRLRFKKALSMLDPIKNAGYSRKKFIKHMLWAVMDYYKWYISPEQKDCYRMVLTDKGVGESHDLTRRFHKDCMHYFPFSGEKEFRRQMYMTKANAQIGEIDTKISLAYGILVRDPIRNVEVVNFCMKTPMKCFSSSDYDRRLVRVGMAGIVPESIRCDMFHRGRQSGDNIYRIKKSWDLMKGAVRTSIYSDETIKYLDKARLDAYFARLDKGLDHCDEMDISFVNDLYSFSSYLKKLQDIIKSNKTVRTVEKNVNLMLNYLRQQRLQKFYLEKEMPL